MIKHDKHGDKHTKVSHKLSMLSNRYEDIDIHILCCDNKPIFPKYGKCNNNKDYKLLTDIDKITCLSTPKTTLFSFNYNEKSIEMEKYVFTYSNIGVCQSYNVNFLINDYYEYEKHEHRIDKSKRISNRSNYKFFVKSPFFPFVIYDRSFASNSVLLEQLWNIMFLQSIE